MFETRLIIKDDKTLIVLDEEILIYDISNLCSPVQVASLPYGINETKPSCLFDIVKNEQLSAAVTFRVRMDKELGFAR